MSAHAPRLLLIDDQPESVATLIECLTSKNVDVAVARSGDHGIAMASVDRPDMILLDVLIPGKGGLDTLQELKREGCINNTPVIFVSASTAIETKLKGFALGAVDYIAKPVCEEEAVARIFLHLSCKQRVDRLEAMVAQSALERVGDEAFPDDILFSQALSMLEQRLAMPPSLVELARELGTNERKLTDVFRRRVGMTVFDYFSEMRLESARHLLGSSGMRIQSIAAHVGYRNAGDFTRAYRRRYGVSPREYRQAQGAQMVGAD